MISRAAIGVGAGVATAIGVGLGANAILDGIAKRNPTGSSADGKASGVLFGAGALAVGSIVGGMVALGRGNASLGAGLIGAGIGTGIGAFGSQVAFGAKHGVGVDTTIDGTIRRYDRDGDRQLDLDPGWRSPEYVREERTSHEDSNGDTYYTYDHYTIERLTSAANTDRDGVVTRPELAATVSSYDADENGRLQGDEAKRFDREVGERHWYGGWF